MSSSERFGPYRILRELGAGGMGRVSLAERDGLDTPVVVKRIHPEHAKDARFRRRLLREAEVAASLQHPNVVRVLDLGVIDDQLYLAMEYVPGSSLAGILAASRPEPLPVAPVLHAVAQACDGLAYVHRFAEPRTGRWMELVHRDVSVDNLLVSYSGEVKLADFGIVKMADGTQTTSGVIMGKLGYMSPEQLRDETLDARSDLYSLGVCLFELLAGRRPLPAHRGRSVMEAVLYDPPVPLEQVRPELPARLVTLVARMLSKDRKTRPASGEEVAAELRALLAGSEEPTLFPSRLLDAPPRNRARPPPAEPATEMEIQAATKPQRLASPPPAPVSAPPPRRQSHVATPVAAAQAPQAGGPETVAAPPPAGRPAQVADTAVAPPPARRPAQEADAAVVPPARRSAQEPETSVAPPPARRPSQEPDTSIAPPPARRSSQEADTSVAPPPARRPSQEPDTSIAPPPARRPSQEPDTSIAPPPARRPSQEADTSVAPPPARRPSQEPDTSIAPPPARRPSQEPDTSVAPPPVRRPPEEAPLASAAQPARRPAQAADTVAAPSPRRSPHEVSVRHPSDEIPTAVPTRPPAYEVPTAVPTRPSYDVPTQVAAQFPDEPGPGQEAQSTRLVKAARSRRKQARIWAAALGGLLFLGAAAFWWWA